MDEEKDVLIDNILEIELRMFLSVPSRERAACQDHPEEFKRNRRAQFSTWSADTLGSYLNDLLLCQKYEKNIMTLKYGRMEGILPRINEDPLIDRIADVQVKWQGEMFDRYPKIMGRARALDSSGDTPAHTSFETYLRGELETYSHETLRLLYEDVKRFLARNANMNEALYAHLVKSLGYGSLAEAESAAD